MAFITIDLFTWRNVSWSKFSHGCQAQFSRGRRNGLATAWAHACGIGLYALFTILGLAILLHKFPMVFKGITYAGAAYLAWLGFNALRSKGGIAERLESGKTCSVAQSAKEGFLISILSPKIAIFLPHYLANMLR